MKKKLARLQSFFIRWGILIWALVFVGTVIFERSILFAVGWILGGYYVSKVEELRR